MVEVKNKKLKLVKVRSKPFLSRQKAPKVYEMNASIYIWKRDALLKTNKVIDIGTGFYLMPEFRSFDIDSELDWQIVSHLLKK